jgi:hypothetical protein
VHLGCWLRAPGCKFGPAESSYCTFAPPYWMPDSPPCMPGLIMRRARAPAASRGRQPCFHPRRSSPDALPLVVSRYASPGAAADQPGVQDWYIPLASRGRQPFSKTSAYIRLPIDLVGLFFPNMSILLAISRSQMANLQHFNRRPSKVQAGYLTLLLPFSTSECP